jgi:2-polyprenyl-3-methyl-5-hydroxy-6-metoxy-1,4-benzoquinol methylase
MTAPARRNVFLDTSTREAAGRWDDLLTLQVELFLQQEAEHLSTLTAWQNARRVVDVGCGNGYYLSRLAARNPDKAFIGVDVSAELIAYAQQRHRAPGLRFEQRDFLRAGAPDCDAIILRFVLQHLPDLESVLRHAAKALRPNGKLIVIDPDFAASSCFPPLPLFTGMFTAFEAWRASLGLLRGGRSLAERMQAFGEWRLESDDLVRVVQAPPFRGSMTAATFAAWVDLCQRAGGFDYPFSEVRAELAAWAAREEATSSVALRVTVLEVRALA